MVDANILVIFRSLEHRTIEEVVDEPRQVGRRIKVDDLLSYRVDPVRRDDVSRELAALYAAPGDLDLVKWIKDPLGIPRKIAASGSIGGNGTNEGLPPARAHALVVKEEEGRRILYGNERTPDCTPKLIAAKFRDARCVKKVPCIHSGVPHKLEQSAVKTLRARLEDEIDSATGRPAKLCVGNRSLLAELPNRIDRGEYHDAEAVVVLVVEDSIHEE